MERLTRFSLERPVLVCVAILLLTAALACQIPLRGTQTGYRAYLGSEHPTVVRLDRFIDGFGGGLPVVALWGCHETDVCDSVFDESALRMAADVVGALQARSDVRRVDSPATTPLLVVTEDELGARSFVQDGEITGSDRLRDLAIRDPLWRGTLVSEDAKVGAIIVQLVSSESDASRAVIRALQDSLAPYEAQGYRFHILGQAAQFALTDESLAADSQRLTPIMIALVAVVVLILFRSWQKVLASLVTVGLASAWTMGIQGAFHWPENSITQTVPPLILVISLCVSLHVLARYGQHRLARGAVTRDERKQALIGAASETGLACLATTTTTAVGFLSFSTSGLESFVRFGVVSAAGILAALLSSFTILPILMMWLPADRIGALRASEAWGRALSTMVRGTRERARSILVGAAVLAGVCLLGTLRLETDVDEYKLYGEESDIVQAFRFSEAHLRRPDSLEIELVLPEGRQLHDPEVLDAVDSFAAEVGRIEGLGRPRSLLDALEWTNRLLKGDRDEFQRLGETASENGSLLTLLSLKDPAALDRWVSPNYRRLRLSVEAEKIPTSRRDPILDQVQAAVRSTLGPEWQATLTGSFAVYRDMTRDIQRTQISSFGIAAGVVFLIMALFLRGLGMSVAGAGGWALAGMFSTVLPVIVTFGVMGFAGVNLDMGTAMVAAIIIGIGADDTIHLLGEFAKRRKRGLALDVSIEGAVLHVGQAVLTTSAALTAGFFVLILSSWQSISSFGFLSGLAILGALAADLWVLPAMVLAYTGRGPKAEKVAGDPTEEAPVRERRVALSLVAVLPFAVIAASVIATGLSGQGIERVLSCRVMPNGSVPLIPSANPACTLKRFDRVLGLQREDGVVYRIERAAFASAVATAPKSVTLLVERGEQRLHESVAVLDVTAADRTARFAVAVALAGGLVLFGLRVYWQSNAAAAGALLLLFSAVGSEILSIAAMSRSLLLDWVSAAIAPMIAAALAHLALTYPRELAIVRLAPPLVWLPYLIAAVLAAIDLRGLGQEPTFWALAVRFELLLIAGATVLLFLGALRSAREADTPLERARGRLLLVGIAGVGFGLAGTYLGWGEGMPGGHLTPFVAGVALFVIPTGFAVTRYDLFDLGLHARRSMDTGLRLAAVGGLTGLSGYGLHRLGLSGAILWSGAGVLGHAAVAVLHGQLDDLMDHGLGRRRRLLLDQERRATELASEDGSARLAGRTLEAGLRTSGVAVFVADGESWRPGYVGRENPAFRADFARAAARLIKGADPVHLARGDVSDRHNARFLREAGVELVAPMAVDGATLGIILVSAPSSGRAFTSEEIGFVRAAASHAAVAIHNARRSAERLAAERRATLGRIVAGVAHDLGNPLRVIERRIRRLADRANDPARVLEEAGQLEEVSRYLIRTVYDLVRDAESDAAGEVLGPMVDEIVSQAIHAIGLPPEQERILVSLAPGVPRLRDGGRLVRVLANLLENALAASGEGEPVWIYATAEQGETRIEVRDRGCGMVQEVAERAFELFFTTRGDCGGQGVGLAISKEIVEGLGGKLELLSARGRGTTAIVRVPEGVG